MIFNKKSLLKQIFFSYETAKASLKFSSNSITKYGRIQDAQNYNSPIDHIAGAKVNLFD